MRWLADFIMRGRLQAAGAVSLLTFLSWFLPPLTYLLSGAPTGLLTLRRGGAIGAQVIAVSLGLTCLFAWSVGISPALGGSFAVGVWLPVWLCSLVLRYTESQALMILAAAAVGLLFAAGMHLAVDNVSEWWHSWLLSWVQANLPEEAAASYAKAMESAVPWLNAMISGALVAGLVLTLLAARWWQAAAFNPGGFRPEFHRLRLPKALALATLLGIGLLAVLKGRMQPLMRDVLVVLLVIWVFHGVAAVHRIASGMRLSRAWLVAMYVLIVVLPQMLVFLSCIGIADSLLGSREAPGGGAGAS